MTTGSGHAEREHERERERHSTILAFSLLRAYANSDDEAIQAIMEARDDAGRLMLPAVTGTICGWTNLRETFHHGGPAGWDAELARLIAAAASGRMDT